MSSEMINGARMLLECLHKVGVTDMFGYPGGAVIPIYDEIYSLSREQYMRQTDMREFLEKWEFVLLLRDLEQQIWLQGL